MRKLGIFAAAVLVALMFSGAAQAADTLTWTAAATGDSATATSFERWGTAAIYCYSKADSTSNAVANTVRVRVRSRSAITVYVTLTETAVASGIFRGTLSLAAYPAGDTIVVDTGGPSLLTGTAYITLAGSDTIAWKDSGCTVTATSFARYGTGYISLTDSHANTSPTVINTVTVRVREDAADTTSVVLTETGQNSNIFTGSVSLATFAAASTITVDTGLGYAVQGSATITLTGSDSIIWCNSTYETTATSAARFGTVYIQLTDSHANTSPTTAETIAVRVRYAGIDTAAVTLTESGVNTNLFRAAYQLTNTGTQTVTVDTGLGYAVQGSLTTDGMTGLSSIAFKTDASYSATATAYVSGQVVYVTLTDTSSNVSPTVLDTVTARVVNNATGAVASVLLTEIGVNSNIFRGSAAVSTSVYATITTDTGAGALRTATASLAIWPAPVAGSVPGVVYIVNQPYYTVTAIDTVDVSGTPARADLGDSYYHVTVSADTDVTVGFTSSVNSSNGDYIKAGESLTFDHLVQYLWIVTRSGLTAAANTCARVRGEK